MYLQKLNFLRKNWSSIEKEIPLRTMAIRLQTNPTTIHNFINGSLRQIPRQLALNIDYEIEFMRSKPKVRDASLFLPSELDPLFRFATRLHTVYTIWDLRVYPEYEPGSGWLTRNVKNPRTINPTEYFLRIPPDTDANGDSLYIRDLTTLLWYKVDYRTKHVFGDEEHYALKRQTTANEYDSSLKYKGDYE